MSENEKPVPRAVAAIKQEAQPLWFQLGEIHYGIEMSQRKARRLVGQLEALSLEAAERQAQDQVDEIRKQKEVKPDGDSNVG